MCRCAGFGDLTGNRKHHRNSVFSRCDHVAERCVHNDHALLGRRFFVDVIRSDTCACDHLKVGRIGKDFLGHFGGRADRKAVVFVDHSGKRVFVFSKVRLEVDVDTTVTKNLNSCVAELVGNEYFGGHVIGPILMYVLRRYNVGIA